MCLVEMKKWSEAGYLLRMLSCALVQEKRQKRKENVMIRHGPAGQMEDKKDNGNKNTSSGKNMLLQSVMQRLN